MGNCIYKLNIDGNFEEFNSEQELNDFLRYNKRVLTNTLLTDKILFSKDRTKQQEVYNTLGALSTGIKFTKEDHSFKRDAGDGEHEYMAVTKLIAYGAKPYLGFNLVTKFDIPAWEKRTKEKLRAQLTPEGEHKYKSEEEVQATVDKVKKSWQTQSMVGTSWHNVAESFFDGEIKTEQDIVTKFPEMANLSNYLRMKYINSLEKFKATLLKKHPNALFLTEVNLFDDETKVAGIVDLLVIDENGELHIYDYKTSAKEELMWDSNKNTGIRYQLGFYRQMLRRKGFNVKSTHILPVEMKEVDYDEGIIHEFDVRDISSRYYYENEPLMFNIKTIMPWSISNDMQQNLTGNTDVHRAMKEMFNYEQKKVIKGSSNVDDEYAKMVANTYSAGKEFYYYKPYGSYGEAFKLDKKLSEAQLKEKITEILEGVDEYNNKLPERITNHVKTAKDILNAGGALSDIEWGKWSKDVGSTIKLRNFLYKYITDPSWELVESDGLMDLNIICFENTKTNELDFVSLTSESLIATPQLVHGGKEPTILGNFLPNRKANELGVTNKMTNGDVELMKVYTFIKNNKALFIDKKIGSIFALNILQGNKIPHIKTQTLGTLEKWYNQIIKHLPEDLGLKASNWEPQEIDKTRAFITYIMDVFQDRSWTGTRYHVDKMKNLVERLGNLKADDIDEKTEILGKLANDLIASVGNNLKTIEQSSDNNNTGLLIKLCTEAILQLNKIPVTIEDDLKQWGVIFDENANTTDPNMFKHEAMKQMVLAVGEALQNARHHVINLLEKQNGIRDIHNKFYKASGNVFKIKALGYNNDIMEKMLEKKDGKFTMRFKDLNDPELTKDQKDYIVGFLTLVNSVRMDKIRKYAGSKGDEAIENFINSPDFRNIPLLKASAITALKGKNPKEFINDYFRDMNNPNNIFKEDEASRAKADAQREMFNGFDLYDVNLSKREERLDTAENGEFETDLEAVLVMYMIAHAKEVEINKKLPVINAIKDMVMINEIYGFQPSENLKKLHKNYQATTIFGKSLLAGESEKATKFVQIGQDTVSLAVMGFSPVSGATELITGFFGNVTRLMANKYTDHTFGAAEYAKAHAVVGGNILKTNSGYEQVNLIEALNETFGFSDMDIKQIAHEMRSTSSGIKNFKSKYAFIFSTFPGYFNRMILFVAQAIKDGVIDVDSTGKITKNSAYQMIDKKLVYNEKLDKRFSLYTNNKGATAIQQTDEWRKQKSLYDAISSELSSEPYGMKSDGTMARAYCNRQRDSLKEFADEVHGSYDAENKANIQKMAFGRIFLQFKSWIRAKKNRWYTGTHINEKRGRFEIVYDEEGNPQHVWKGKVVEGICQTILAMYDELKTNKGNIFKSWDNMNSTQKENFMFMISDMFLFGLITMILSMFDEDDMKKNDPVGYLGFKALKNSSKDLFIWNSVTSIAGDKNPLSLMAWGTNVLEDSWGAITGKVGATDLMKNVAIYRTINTITNVGQ